MDLDFIMEMKQELLLLINSRKFNLESSIDPKFREAIQMLVTPGLDVIAGERKKWKSVEEAEPPVGFTGRLVRGEKWRDCPYYKGHKYIRPFVHLLKCRKRHREECQSAQKELDIEICRYNWTHHIPKNELAEHEMQCEDQSLSYMYLHEHIVRQRAENQKKYSFE